MCYFKSFGHSDPFQHTVGDEGQRGRGERRDNSAGDRWPAGFGGVPGRVRRKGWVTAGRLNGRPVGWNRCLFFTEILTF